MKIQALFLALLFATSIQAASVEKPAMASFGEFVAHNFANFDFFKLTPSPVFEVVEISDPILSKTLAEFPIRMGVRWNPPSIELRSRVTSIKVPSKTSITQEQKNPTAEYAFKFVQQIAYYDQIPGTSISDAQGYINNLYQVFDEPLMVYGKAPNTWVKFKRLY